MSIISQLFLIISILVLMIVCALVVEKRSKESDEIF